MTCAPAGRRQAAQKAEGIIRQPELVLFRDFYSYALRSALLCAHTENKPLCKFIKSFGNRATKF